MNGSPEDANFGLLRGDQANWSFERAFDFDFKYEKPILSYVLRLCSYTPLSRSLYYSK